MENMRLSPSCNLEDFVLSETAIRQNIDNWPRESVIIDGLRLLATEILEPVRLKYDTRPMVSSGYRCPALNVAVGGAEGSQHTLGQAVDFELPGQDLLTVANWMAQALKFDQLILEKAHTSRGVLRWVHCSYVSLRENRQHVSHAIDGVFIDGLPEQF